METLRMGVVGCGAIAQIQHLPHLRDDPERFEIHGLCDISQHVLEMVGPDYQVPPSSRFTEMRDLLASDVDAVLICSSGTHAPQVIAAAQAGKHVLVEKPACATMDEAEAMVSACDAAGVRLMVAYPKRHEPSFEFALPRIRSMRDIRLVQVNHFHPSNDLHMAEFSFHRAIDISQKALEERHASDARLVAKALGVSSVDDTLVRAYQTVNGSLIHDISVLHGIFGMPDAVLATEIWKDGGGITTTLQYPDDVLVLMTWIDLPDLWAFEETFAVYACEERVTISFPTGFSRGLPTTVIVQEPDADGTPMRRELCWHENPFKRELEHFHAAVTMGGSLHTPGDELKDHLMLVREIVRASFAKRSEL